MGVLEEGRVIHYQGDSEDGLRRYVRIVSAPDIGVIWLGKGLKNVCIADGHL